ncbi:hypothetical protein V5O48_011673 [Marasmius crinis-equi]|uniref:Transmembrane protein n=1 Tax=Marasmius crinis-equi TaxID=585013 RepID=A0ABR3F4Z0_9AGAR
MHWDEDKDNPQDPFALGLIRKPQDGPPPEFFMVTDPDPARKTFQATITVAATGPFLIAAMPYAFDTTFFTATQTIFAVSPTQAPAMGESTTNGDTRRSGSDTTTSSEPSVTPPPNAPPSIGNTKAIIGGVVGGTVGLLIMGLMIVFLRRRGTRPFHPFNFRRLNHRRHQSFGITALPLPDSPLLQPTPFVIHRKSPRTVEQNPPLDVSPPPAEMGDRKERMPEDGVDTCAAGMQQQSDGQTHQNSTEIPQEQPNEQSRDPEVLAQQMAIVVQRLAQLEARFDEEAPPDYTSNRS